MDNFIRVKKLNNTMCLITQRNYSKGKKGD